MAINDLALYYSSSAGKSVYGIMKVITAPYQDPTTSSDWLSIDFEPIKTFEKPITLEQIKQNNILKKTEIIRQPRLSVVKMSEEEYKEIVGER